MDITWVEKPAQDIKALEILKERQVCRWVRAYIYPDNPRVKAKPNRLKRSEISFGIILNIAY